MYRNIFDTHAHYDDEKFNEDREKVLNELPTKGVVNVINCGCDLSSSLKSAEFSKKYSYFYFAAGIHPSNITVNSYSELEQIKSLYSNPKCVAIGEIGLEYHYDFVPKDKQIYFFKKQLELANDLNLPVIVHDREAHEDTIKLLKKYKPKGVVHCFSGSVEMAEEVLKLGMYIGLGGAVTFKNAKKPLEIAKIVSKNRLLLETDCPYMTPVPFRGQRNSSDLITYSADKIAEIRQVDTQHLIDSANRNAHCLFNI